MRGERDKKGAPVADQCPFLWCSFTTTAPNRVAPAGVTRRNDRNSGSSRTARAGTRKGPTKGPLPLAAPQTWNDSRDKPLRQAAATPRRSVAATRSKESGEQEPVSYRRTSEGAPPRQRDTRAAKQSPAGHTCKPVEDWPPGMPAAPPSFSYRSP